jgi:hypothetical protein
MISFTAIALLLLALTAIGGTAFGLIARYG